MAIAAPATIRVDRRFNGPPAIGNGGYVAGRLSEYVETSNEEPAVAVRLFASPPLETPLSVREEGEGVALFDSSGSEESRIALAWPVALDLAPPPAPSFDEAVAAARGFRGFEEHVFRECFVCGPGRAEGDGLRIFPGESATREVFAAPWVPDASLARAGSNKIAPEFIWAALDCPGAFSFPQPEGKVLLLGEMTIEIRGEIEIFEECVISSWVVEHSGRKHLTGSAIYDRSGRCCGLAQGLWFEIDPDAVPNP